MQNLSRFYNGCCARLNTQVYPTNLANRGKLINASFARNFNLTCSFIFFSDNLCASGKTFLLPYLLCIKGYEITALHNLLTFVSHLMHYLTSSLLFCHPFRQICHVVSPLFSLDVLAFSLSC